MDFAKRERLIALAEQVAEALPGAWDVKPFPEDWGRIGAWLTDPDSKAQLAIGETQSRPSKGIVGPTHGDGRLDVSTDYPRDSQGNSAYEPRPKITISSSKTGAQIAKDIERRLFPEYLPLLQKVLTRYHAYDEHEKNASAVAKQIADVVRVKHDPKSETVSFYHSPYPIFSETMSQVQVLGGDEVELTLRLDPDTAIDLLKSLIGKSRQ